MYRPRRTLVASLKFNSNGSMVDVRCDEEERTNTFRPGGSTGEYCLKGWSVPGSRLAHFRPRTLPLESGAVLMSTG